MTAKRTATATAPGLLSRLWSALVPPKPPTGAQRRDARQFAQRSFKAGQSNRLTSQMLGGLYDTTADQESYQYIARVNRVARELVRNDPAARTIVDKLRREIIGTRGLWPQVKTDTQVLNDEIEMKFRKWSRACGLLSETWVEIQRQIVNEVTTVGESFVSWGILDGRVVIQCHETEALSGSFANGGPQVAAGNQIIGGIEYDTYGRPLNYYISKTQPGPWGNTFDYQTLPAERVSHIFFRDRPSQWRGVSTFAPVVITLYDVGSAEYAELTGLKFSACVQMVHKTATGDVPGAEDADSASTSGLDLELRVEPGVVNAIGPDESLELMDPKRPGGQFLPFVSSLFSKVAACVGLPQSRISGDYSKTNYSSDRSESIACRPTYMEWQELVIADFCEPIFRHWLEYAIITGEVKLRRYTIEDIVDATSWQRPGFSNVDQEKEAKATALELALGLTTLSQAAAERGQDLRELAKQRKADKAMLAEYQIDADALIAAANGQPSEAPPAADPNAAGAPDTSNNTQPQAVNQ